MTSYHGCQRFFRVRRDNGGTRGREAALYERGRTSDTQPEVGSFRSERGGVAVSGDKTRYEVGTKSQAQKSHAPNVM